MTRRTPLRRQPAAAAVSAAAPSAIIRAATIADVQQAWGKFKRSRRAHAEHDLQEQVASYLDRALPPDAFWTSIDSAGRGAIQGARMKRRGVKRGLPDILILAGAPNYYTIWLELKSVKGTFTKEQRAFAAKAGNHAHIARACRSVEDVEAVLRTCCIPLRCRIAA